MNILRTILLREKQIYRWMVASIVLALVGAVGPWTQVSGGNFSFSQTGTEMGDGWFIVGMALAALVFLFVSRAELWNNILISLLGLGIFIIGVADHNDINTNLQHNLITTIGWGVDVVAIAGLSLFLAGLVEFVNMLKINRLVLGEDHELENDVPLEEVVGVEDAPVAVPTIVEEHIHHDVVVVEAPEEAAPAEKPAE